MPTLTDLRESSLASLEALYRIAPIGPRPRGRFRMEFGRSRWRDAEVLRLEYDVSRLPRRVRGSLYDEVKPLSETLCLGLGGINAGPGKGDLFFFALEPYRDGCSRGEP